MKRIFIFLLIATSSLQTIAQTKKLEAFSLKDVRLLESPFLQAEETDKTYMLSLNPDRLLAPYLKEAGLTPKAESYGNWENTGLDGHIGGHYVSALSLMYAATGDAKVKERLDYMIDELEKCQLKNGNGYLSGVPGGKEIWAEIKSGNIKASSFSLNGKWVPLYNIHKIFAGLHDAYAVADNEKAKQMLIRLTDWCIDLVAGLSDQQIQELLKSEHGGLNEIFADVYALTGDKKYLKLARQFSDQSILKPLLEQKDALNGLHANTQIPKVIGFEQIARVDHDASWAKAAGFFWQTVVNNRTVAIGGNSVREHFHPANDFSSMLESREGPETCNSYNMLKLTKQLFLDAPSIKYLDYYERTLYNHILTSQRAGGGFVYFTPMRPGHYRTYSNPQESFWCCVGSGLENHGKYGELIYAHDDQNLYVNLFIPSVINWKEKGITLTQRNQFPNQEFTQMVLKMDKKQQFSIRLRHPSWVAAGQMTILVNGKKIMAKALGNGYVRIDRVWSSGDVIKVALPMHNTAQFMPDGSDWVAFLHGPIVLAAELDTLSQPNLTADGSRMGHIASGPLFPLSEAPLVSGKKTDLAQQLTPVKNEVLTFSAEKIIYQPKYKNLKLVPFYELAEKRYVVYFPYTNPENLEAKAKAIKLAETEKIKLEQETVDIVRTGEQQPESDHGFKGEDTDNGIFQDQHFRAGKGWFSYNLANKDLKGKKIRLTFYGKEKNRNFQILINHVVVEKVKLDGSKGDVFYSQDFEIPENLLKSQLELTLKAEPGSAIASIFEVRLVK
ncbi:glycoside hydrolase family 127 protein [Pedobacter sp. MR22-3]|uniref:glycoside hydrolase family 127 protein n=1 Tax=Pedobacter sp. MR22-3 TaxID=2994552 RepID=UPI00224564B0|nr:glycoside hydrolase family 127 protein [Pedobacter sp. MR22-3]MCX2583358.1 glycoside hydrolase family 127 protein [Pedobacter sp. MR22-3]